MKIKPFQQQSRYTTMDNFIIDHVMPKISGSAWKVLTVIIRKTIGWHKECDEVSFRQLLGLTGIKSFTTLTNALKELEDKKIIRVDRGEGKGITFIYALNLDFELEIKEPVTIFVTEEKSVTENVTPPVTENVTPKKEVLQKLEQQKKEESLNKESKRGRASPPPVSVKTYQDIASRYPDKAVWAAIVQTVGDSPEALEFWRQVITTWIGCGYNKLNVTGMLDCFKRKELPSTRKGNSGNGLPLRASPPKTGTIDQDRYKKLQAEDKR